MARFDEILEHYGSEDSEYPDAETLRQAYDEDMSIPAAKIAELEQANAEANTVVAELKARNYDLLISAPSNDDSPSEPDDEEDPEKTITTDDLFE